MLISKEIIARFLVNLGFAKTQKNKQKTKHVNSKEEKKNNKNVSPQVRKTKQKFKSEATSSEASNSKHSQNVLHENKTFEY